MIDKFLNPITLLLGPCLVIYLCVKSEHEPTGSNDYLPVWNILLSYIGWLFLTRSAKLVPHLLKRPQDVIYIPVWLLFAYYFSVMKIYTLFTLHEVCYHYESYIPDTERSAGRLGHAKLECSV